NPMVLLTVSDVAVMVGSRLVKQNMWWWWSVVVVVAAAVVVVVEMVTVVVLLLLASCLAGWPAGWLSWLGWACQAHPKYSPT
ncbi:MAG: hypothetical protein VX992_07545, partial [Acidobacteriota bacterium]|nr:hypothetical protein [Acidobacteriota bacterium]